MTKLIENIIARKTNSRLVLPFDIHLNIDTEIMDNSYEESFLVYFSAIFQQGIRVPSKYIEQAEQDFKHKLVNSVYGDLHELLYKLSDTVYEGDRAAIFNVIDQIFKETRLR